MGYTIIKNFELNTCTQCGIEKFADYFYTQNATSDKPRNICKQCIISTPRIYVKSRVKTYKKSHINYIVKGLE